MKQEIKTLLDVCLPDDLIEVRAYIESLLSEQKQAKMRELANELKVWGISTSELNEATKASGKKLTAKYRHPDYPELTWVGRGKCPIWLSELCTRTGKTKDDFLIEKPKEDVTTDDFLIEKPKEDVTS